LGVTVNPAERGFMPFVYPALVAVLFLPLSLLPYPGAFVAMLAVNVLLCGFALDLLSRRFQVSPRGGRLLVLCAALSISVILTLANGQISFLVLLVFIMLVGDIREGRARAGFWAGLLVFKPTLLPVFLLWFLFRGEWKNLLYAALTGGVLLLVSLLLVGPQALTDYWEMSVKMATEQYATVNSARMPNIRSLSDFIGYGEAVGIGLSIVVLGLLLVKRRRATDAACAALVLATVLLARHIHYQDLNPLLIVVAMALGKGTVTVALRWGLLGGTLLTTALVMSLASRQSNLPILPVCLLIAFLAFALKKSPATPKPATG
jgi:hypothetical protein